MEDTLTDQGSITGHWLKYFSYFFLYLIYRFVALQKQKCICDEVERLEDASIEEDKILDKLPPLVTKSLFWLFELGEREGLSFEAINDASQELEGEEAIQSSTIHYLFE